MALSKTSFERETFAVEHERNRMYHGRAFSQQFLTKHMHTQQKLEKLVSNRTDSSVSVDEKVEAAGRGSFLFPTYLGRSKGLCSQGSFSHAAKKTFSIIDFLHHVLAV